tara:strand:- start:288 stop:794 length:507 start_codon:yes stop_codon:yes gene_type:complete
MATITPTLSLLSNASTATLAGPLSVALSLSATKALTVDTVNSKIVTLNLNDEIVLYDGSTMSGTDTTTEGAGGTYGGYLYLKNVTASGTGLIYIGLDHDGGAATDIGAANQAEDGTASAAIRLFTLKVGEFCWMPFDYTFDIIADASLDGSGTTVPKLECWHFNRSAT